MSITRALDPKYFNSPEVFASIRDKLFYNSWQYACHISQVANPGDYITLSIFDQDIIVLRERGGELRALYNVCQHRGHKLVEGSGNKRLLVCPYHAWAYDLNGQLKGAPNSENVSGFDKSTICVPSIRVENFLGFVFINLNDDAPEMDAVYPDVRASILEICPDIEQRQFAHEQSCNEGCNWIVAVENYNECYHCKVCHPQFAKGVIDPSSYSVQPFGGGQTLRHTGFASKSDDAWYDVSGSDYRSHYLWPAAAIQVYPSGMVNGYYWRPINESDTRVHRTWFSKDGNVDKELEKVIQLDFDTTFSEDIEIVKHVQRGLQSRGYKPGPLILDPNGGIDNELSVATIHQWLKDSLEDDA